MGRPKKSDTKKIKREEPDDSEPEVEESTENNDNDEEMDPEDMGVRKLDKKEVKSRTKVMIMHIGIGTKGRLLSL